MLRLLPSKDDITPRRRRDSKIAKQLSSKAHIPKEGLPFIPEKAQKLLGETGASTAGSALLGLTAETRSLIKNSWELVSSKTPTINAGESPLNRFFEYAQSCFGSAVLFLY